MGIFAFLKKSTKVPSQDAQDSQNSDNNQTPTPSKMEEKTKTIPEKNEAEEETETTPDKNETKEKAETLPEEDQTEEETEVDDAQSPSVPEASFLKLPPRVPEPFPLPHCIIFSKSSTSKNNSVPENSNGLIERLKPQSSKNNFGTHSHSDNAQLQQQKPSISKKDVYATQLRDAISDDQRDCAKTGRSKLKRSLSESKEINRGCYTIKVRSDDVTPAKLAGCDKRLKIDLQGKGQFRNHDSNLSSSSSIVEAAEQASEEENRRIQLENLEISDPEMSTFPHLSTLNQQMQRMGNFIVSDLWIQHQRFGSIQFLGNVDLKPLGPSVIDLAKIVKFRRAGVEIHDKPSLALQSVPMKMTFTGLKVEDFTSHIPKYQSTPINNDELNELVLEVGKSMNAYFSQFTEDNGKWQLLLLPCQKTTEADSAAAELILPVQTT